MTGLNRYARHAERFGWDGVLEAAAAELSKADYAQLLGRLSEGDGIECATPGCPVVFVPARKGQRFHSAACRQKAHRIRTGQEAGVDRRRRPRASGVGQGSAGSIRVTNAVQAQARVVR